jgi:hypothetical protein
MPDQKPLKPPITDRDLDVAVRVFFWTLAAALETAANNETSVGMVCHILLESTDARERLRVALQKEVEP